MSSNGNDEKYTAPALDKGLSVIEFLSRKGGFHSQKEIAEGIGYSADSIYRMLAVLERRGYIVRDEKSGAYRLSLLIYHLAHTYAPIDSFKHIALGPMDELADVIGHSCHLSTIFQGRTLVLTQSRSAGPVSLMIEEGGLFPLVRTASGRVLLAFSKESERAEILSKDADFLRLGDDAQHEFLEQLHRIRADGYCVAKSEITRMVTDLSVFVGFPDSSLVAALAVSRIASDITVQVTDQEILERLIATAGRINVKLGSHVAAGLHDE